MTSHTSTQAEDRVKTELLRSTHHREEKVIPPPADLEAEKSPPFFASLASTSKLRLEVSAGYFLGA